MKLSFEDRKRWMLNAPTSMRTGVALFAISWGLQVFGVAFLGLLAARLPAINPLQKDGLILITTFIAGWLILGAILLVSVSRKEKGARLIALLLVAAGSIIRLFLERGASSFFINVVFFSYAASVACFFTQKSNAWFGSRQM